MVRATRFWVLGLVLALMISSAEAASLSIVGVDDMNTPSYSGSNAPTYSSKSGFGGGLLINEALSRDVSFEFGGLYLTHELQQSGGGVDTLTITTHVIQIPAQLKFRFLRMLHIGLGGYFAQGIGNIDVEDSTTPASSNSSQTWSGANLKQTDYGLLGSAGLSLPITMRTHLMVEGRYDYGLANISTASGTTLKNRDIQILAGFTFYMGGRNR